MISTLLALILDYNCLVRQVLIEAEGESLAGKAMVAEVIRERSRRSGLGYCAVIAQPRQFGTRPLRPPVRVVVEAVTALWHEPACSAVHFDVRGNRWSANLQIRCTVGRLVFYEGAEWRG